MVSTDSGAAQASEFEERPLRGANLRSGVDPRYCGPDTNGPHILLTAAMRTGRPKKVSNSCFARPSS